MNAQVHVRPLLFGLLVLLLSAGCAVDGGRYNPETGGPANPWGGVWAVLTAVLTFVIGFLAGATMLWNGGFRRRHRHHRHRSEAGWDRIALRIQDGIRQGLADCGGAARAHDADWTQLSRRIEERIIEEMRKHGD